MAYHESTDGIRNFFHLVIELLAMTLTSELDPDRIKVAILYFTWLNCSVSRV